MRQKQFLFAVPVQRAILETLILGAALWSQVFLISLGLPSFVSVWELEVVLLIDIVCLLYYVLRLQLPQQISCRQILRDTIVAIAVCLAVCCISIVPLFAYSHAFSGPIGVEMALVFVANFVGYFICRVGAHILLFWNRLRRKHLLWALTHSHVMLLVLVAGGLILMTDIGLFMISTSQYSTSPDSHTLIILPLTTIILAILSFIVLIIIVPPFALFSYFVIRRTTERLQALMIATSVLRGGNYSVRVPVSGEDEVAQLQTDFNMMAADLECTMTALQEERDRVAALLQERRELIANVSHELRTPVATLRGYLETTLIHWDETSRPALHHDLQVMEDEVNHLQARVEDLFSLARAELGMLKLHCEPTDVKELVRSIVEIRAPLAWRSSRIEVVADVPSSVPLIMADPRRLEQALQNLLHNGLRHTSPGGIVAIAVTKKPDTVVIQIKDTGEGIAPRDLPHIWERFYQTENARTRMGGGTGLGLSLVKEWIEGMKGTVAVESVLGEGSCFTLCLPEIPIIDMQKIEITRKRTTPL